MVLEKIVLDRILVVLEFLKVEQEVVVVQVLLVLMHLLVHRLRVLVV